MPGLRWTRLRTPKQPKGRTMTTTFDPDDGGGENSPPEDDDEADDHLVRSINKLEWPDVAAAMNRLLGYEPKT
jgi:hypothetical protein